LASAELRRWLTLGKKLGDEALPLGDPLDLESDRVHCRLHSFETLSSIVEDRGWERWLL
jgi:hypothetical protein